MPFQFPPPDRFDERMRSRIHEGASLTPYDVRAIIVPLYTQLTTTTTRGNAVYRLPFNQKFRISQILPHCCPTVPTAESLSGAGGVPANGLIFLNPTGEFSADTGKIRGLNGISDYMLAKMHNCRIDLKITSATNTVQAQPALSLASLHSRGSETMRFFDMPLILGSGSTIEMSASLQDSTASLVGSTTEYGVVLVGSLIRTN